MMSPDRTKTEKAEKYGELKFHLGTLYISRPRKLVIVETRYYEITNLGNGATIEVRYEYEMKEESQGGQYDFIYLLC